MTAPTDIDWTAFLDGTGFDEFGRLHLVPAASRELLKMVQHAHDCGECSGDEDRCRHLRGCLAEAAAYLDH